MIKNKFTPEQIETARVTAGISLEEFKLYDPNKDYTDGKFKRFEGRLGKEVFKSWLEEQGYNYTILENGSDFGVLGYNLAVRTRTKKNHTRLIEDMTNFVKHVNDYYIGAHLHYADGVVELYGYITREDFEPLTYDTLPMLRDCHTAKNHQLTSQDINTLFTL